ncbi:hypothetical protein JOF47_002188 [Paeniglutamicibacter kerguelensis]|uniref:Uncharacterized protein n=1 Tax=Paeniglutamicibacter kerguelensis TaxID=254788 RepID=A0ABS4XDW9_9MICC|nr:hypothetical protein [Paeniglutamicibacter kerguelensis]
MVNTSSTKSTWAPEEWILLAPGVARIRMVFRTDARPRRPNPFCAAPQEFPIPYLNRWATLAFAGSDPAAATRRSSRPTGQ